MKYANDAACMLELCAHHTYHICGTTYMCVCKRVVFCNKRQTVASKTVLTNLCLYADVAGDAGDGWASDEAREDERGQLFSLSACDNT